MADFTIKQNDLLPEISGICQDAAGVAVNLTTATGVAFHMVASVGGATKVNAAAVVVDATNGIVKYSWAGTDTNLVGDFLAEFEVTFPGPKQLTFPNDSNLTVSIVDDLV